MVSCVRVNVAAKVGVAEVELKLELKSKEAELEGLRQAVSMEEKERADIIAAEKKMRLQVRDWRELWVCVLVCACVCVLV